MTHAVFPLNSARNMGNAIAFIGDQKLDAGLECVVRDIRRGKTLAQLGALFGVWVEWLSNEYGYSEDRIHKEWKRQFLVRIYCTEQEGPFENEQTIWVDHLTTLQEKGDWAGLRRHCDRVSLRWASLNQTKKYMDAIQNHYIDLGTPLPIPDKFRGFYSE